ncbi:MAG TPA: hypothetical protein VMY37_37915 [Thermoguttaceae bacterium]|nr:hypothetical protein [Thermoguttaceae bacterium]
MADAKEKTVALLSTTTVGTNLATTGETTIYTVPAGKTCILSHAWLKASADVGGSLDFTIGQDTAETDFVGTTAGDNLDNANDVILIAPVPSATPTMQKAYAAGTVIKFKVTVAGNAVTGTVYLFGFLF